jgi:hypothetical protein
LKVKFVVAKGLTGWAGLFEVVLEPQIDTATFSGSRKIDSVPRRQN